MQQTTIVEGNMAGQESGRQTPPPSRLPSMRMVWHDLLFMHWPVAPAILGEMLPGNLQLDTWEGQAWISVVPFHMSGVAPRWMPNVPWLSKFPELNVRTYVIHDGIPGVWFFTLDATNPIAVRTARRWFHLNYVDARIDIEREGNWLKYHSVRTDRKQPGGELKVDYRPLGVASTAVPGSIAEWLTARYCLYVVNRKGQIFRGDIDHAPWQLRNAQIVMHRNSMLDPYGVDVSDGPQFIQFAERTDVVAWSLQPA